MTDPEAGFVVALLDVLGFENRLARVPLAEVHRQYEELLKVAAAKGRGGAFFDARPVGDGTMVPFFGFLDLNYDYFSDTILLWTQFTTPTLMPFVHSCCSLLCSMLLLDLPVRGALALGPAIMNKNTRTYLGKPVVEAARVEKAQRWVGLGLGPSFGNRGDIPMRADLIRPYKDHLKPEAAEAAPGLAVDWPRVWRSDHEGSPIPLLQRLAAQGDAAEYYQRAIEFVRRSDADPEWWIHYRAEHPDNGIPTDPEGAT